MGAVLAAVIHRKELDVLEAFRSAGATSPASARSLEDIGLDDTWPVHRLHNRAVVRESGAGLYYLDEEVWAALHRTRRRVVLALVVVLLAVLVTTGVFASWFH